MAFFVTAKTHEYYNTHAQPASSPPPYSDFLIYFVERSKSNPALNQPAPFPLGDQGRQAVIVPTSTIVNSRASSLMCTVTRPYMSEGNPELTALNIRTAATRGTAFAQV